MIISMLMNLLVRATLCPGKLTCNLCLAIMVKPANSINWMISSALLLAASGFIKAKVISGWSAMEDTASRSSRKCSSDVHALLNLESLSIRLDAKAISSSWIIGTVSHVPSKGDYSGQALSFDLTVTDTFLTAVPQVPISILALLLRPYQVDA